MADYTKLINVPESLVELSKLSSQKLVKIISRTHRINNVDFTMLDISLPRFKEDKLYETNKTIWQLVPRGLCYIFANNTYVKTVYGHPKFGNFGDHYWLDSYDEKNNYQYAFTMKENGECGHFSVFEFNQTVYYVIGSKNVHLIISGQDDIKLYLTEQRYSFASKIATLLLAKYDLTKAVDYILENSCTFCMESCMLDSQHLVKYDENKLFFFAVTDKYNGSSLTVVNPIVAINLFQSLGLPTVSLCLVANNPMEKNLIENQFENMKNSEGSVVVAIDQNQNSVYIYKHKNFDYILRRALREKMRSKSTLGQIEFRLSNLYIKHPDYENMKQWAIRFNAWWTINGCPPEIFSKWTDYEEQFSLVPLDEQDRYLAEYTVNQTANGSTQKRIMFVGIPGSGKSTLARLLAKLFNDSKHIEQDQFADKGRNASKLYHKEVEKYADDKNCKYLILSKSHHNHLTRNMVYNILDKSKLNTDLAFVVIDSQDENMHDICLERITSRGLSHASLFGSNSKADRNKVSNLLSGVFIAQYEPLDESEKQRGTVINLDISNTKEQNIMDCLEGLFNSGFITQIPDNGIICNAIDEINFEDQQIAQKNMDKILVLYDGIIYNPDQVFQIFQHPIVKQLLDQNKQLKPLEQLHITTKYYGGKSIHEADDYKCDLDVETHIIGVICDEKCLALLVEKTFDCQNEYPHITLATNSETSPAYSNQMIQKLLGMGQMVTIDGFKLVGTTYRETKMK